MVGNAEELITLIFLQSFLPELREVVMIKLDAPIDEMVDTELLICTQTEFSLASCSYQ